jgi:inosine/xanthosine triphosphatase
MNNETEQGALNRLNFIKKHHPDADYFISQEGGTFEDEDRLFNRAWIVVCDRNGHVTKSSTALFYLPTKIVEYIRAGMELGDANNKFFDSVHAKDGNSAIAHLTDGLLTREDYYLQAAIIALSELKHQDWYI